MKIYIAISRVRLRLEIDEQNIMFNFSKYIQ